MHGWARIYKVPTIRIMEFHNPYRVPTWDVDTEDVCRGDVLTLRHVQACLKEGYLISPQQAEECLPMCSTILEHAARVAWLVKNYRHSKLRCVSIDWADNGSASMDYGSMVNPCSIDDGNHRFAAAIYRRERYIYAELSGFYECCAEVLNAQFVRLRYS